VARMDADDIAMPNRLAEQGLAPLLFGGKAGDNLRFEETVVVNADAIYTEGAIAVGLYGEGLQVSASTTASWPTFDEVFHITDADANLIRTINHRPAVEVYAERLGGRPEDVLKDSGFHPLIILDEEGQPLFARTVFGHDAETGSLMCAGNVPAKQVKVANLSTPAFLEGVDGVMGDVLQAEAELTLVASCVGRRLALGSEVVSEGATIRDRIDSQVPLIGLYCYGEVGFCPHLKQSYFLNHSFTAMALREI